MARAGDVVALRKLGLSLAQVHRVLHGKPSDLTSALAAHEAALDAKVRQSIEIIERVRTVRAGFERGSAPALGDPLQRGRKSAAPVVAFDLPWPWGGERFELHDVRALNFIVGPLGSGKTRLAIRLAEALPDGVFLGLDRSVERGAVATEPSVAVALSWLADAGATISGALVALMSGINRGEAAAVVVDMVEQGLDQATQEALVRYLRRRGPNGRPLFLMTRSSAILDLALAGHDEAIIYCPANHSVPMRVAPHRGSDGYEALATCLASPDVRARTAGVIAWRATA